MNFSYVKILLECKYYKIDYYYYLIKPKEVKIPFFFRFTINKVLIEIMIKPMKKFDRLRKHAQYLLNVIPINKATLYRDELMFKRKKR